MGHERTGVFLVRVWMEGNDASTVRARITQRAEIDSLEETETVAAGVDDIEDTLRSWLHRFVAGTT